MVGSRKLSNDEVEALLGGLEGEEEQAVAAQFDPNEVREFTFGSEDLSLLGDYYALRMINEKIFPLYLSVNISDNLVIFLALVLAKPICFMF